MLDRVDGPGELLDRPRQRLGEVLDQGARGADLPRVDRIGLERRDRGRVAQERRHSNRGAGLEVAVVGARPELVEEA